MYGDKNWVYGIVRIDIKTLTKYKSKISKFRGRFVEKTKGVKFTENNG
jgi:hypothetical protein